MKLNDNWPYYFGFSHFLGIGPIRCRALVKYFGNIKKAYQANKTQIQEIIGSKLSEKFILFRQQFDPIKKLEELKIKEISVISQENPYYPFQLKNINDPPICLYIKGDITKFQFNQSKNKFIFAVVGTRKPTSYGQQITKKFVAELTQAGFIVVSGLAMGIDTIVHQSCLQEDGRTIAVLGCGVDIIYPSINTKLYYQIINNKGLIISEFPPGHTVAKGLFIARNRLISGLSMGVLIIEGAQDSGAMITARYAAEQGKEVFAPPAPITSQMSQAPNTLLKQGAKLVTSIEDILEEFNLKLLPKKAAEVDQLLSEEEKIIYHRLDQEAKSIDELIVETKKSINTILNTVSLLEIKGIVEKNNDGKYQLKNSI